MVLGREATDREIGACRFAVLVWVGTEARLELESSLGISGAFAVQALSKALEHRIFAVSRR